MQKTSHIYLIYFRPADAISLQLHGLVNKITGKYSESYQQRQSSLKLTDTARSD